MPDFRLLRMPSGRVFKARVVPHVGLGTALDQFFWERRIDPGNYSPMSHRPIADGCRWPSNKGRSPH